MTHIAKNQELLLALGNNENSIASGPYVLYGFQNATLQKKQNLNILTENDGERLMDSNVDLGNVEVMGEISGIGSIRMTDTFLRTIVSAGAPAGSGKTNFDVNTGVPQAATIELTKGAYRGRYTGLRGSSLSLTATAGPTPGFQLTTSLIGLVGAEVEKIKTIQGSNLIFENEVAYKAGDVLQFYNAAGILVHTQPVSVVTSPISIMVAGIPPAVEPGHYCLISDTTTTANAQVIREKPLNLAKTSFGSGFQSLTDVRDCTISFESDRRAIFTNMSLSAKSTYEAGVRVNGSIKLGVSSATSLIATANAGGVLEEFSATLRDVLNNQFKISGDIVLEKETPVELDGEILTNISFRFVKINEVSTTIN